LEIRVEHNGDDQCNQVIPVTGSGACGCIDPAANNYDPNATTDDGSCIYPPANNDCVNAQNLSVATFPAVSNALGTLYGATPSGAEACTGSAEGGDVFYSFTLAQENHVVVSVNSFAGADVVVEILDDCNG